MGYRDEKASLRARVAELERELAKKDLAIARLEGRRQADDPVDASHSKLLDAPLALTLERTLDHAVSNEGLEAIAQVLRERLRIPVSQVGRTVRGQQGTVLFELTMADGRTRLRLEATYRDRWNGFSFVGGPLTGLMAAIATVGALAPFGLAPILMGSALALVGGLAPYVLLRLIRSVVRDEQTNVTGTFEAASALAEEYAEREEEEVRTRVASEEPAVEEAPAFETTEEPDAEASA